jgi:hypothetical protein
MLRIQADRHKLLKCLDRTFQLTEDVSKEAAEKRMCLERETRWKETEREAEQLAHDYKMRLKECQSPCIERTWANDLKEVIRFMEQKQKQKQVYKDDWKDATVMLTQIVSRLKDTKEVKRPQRKTVKKANNKSGALFKKSPFSRSGGERSPRARKTSRVRC